MNSPFRNDREILRRAAWEIFSSRGYLTEHEFLPESWRILNAFFRYHRTSPLVEEQVGLCRFFLCRIYTLTVVLHATFSMEQQPRGLLETAIEYLEEDLTEVEIKLRQRLEKCDLCMIYPGVARVYEQLWRIYESEEFDSEKLPPTHWHAFPLLVLNQPHFARELFAERDIYNSLVHLNGSFVESVRPLLEG
jgi:hypothetical protein